ncbi:MAG: metalloregulator ArsR/SmtB family transcription factor [Gammaproteobacteria bacterium]|nr:metalloregulator ArsR/SmtB family transcription factor [Gammaproteobacteria bacterium]
MKSRDIKNLLYEQVSRIGKAVSSPKRLELIEILCQGEKSVDQLAADAEISVKLASAHLKELRVARLVEARRDGKNMFYRLADPMVANLWVELRSLAEERLLDLQTAMRDLVTRPEDLAPVNGKDLLAQAKRGEVVVIDVRPHSEYVTAHLPLARSIPVTELKKRIGEIPRDKTVVAYCRGPFCLMAKEAVDYLRTEGFQALRVELGIAEWRASGLPLETEA